MKKFSIYKVITVLALIALFFILALPQFFDINKKQNADECVKNMKIIYNAIKLYMEEHNEDFIGDQKDLVRTGYLKRNYTCKAGKPDDKYLIEGDYETGKITVRCQHEDEFPDHKLPESLRQ
ncbi:MAG: hypothetical protein K8S23_05415 [Candidatus Cloacimonetes bacterium]|nr:hypothetical protein [Candidatus Cloacimonadota bacterium]